MKINVEVSTVPSKSVRAQQLSAAFDVPAQDRQTIRWEGDMPIEERDWQVGLIVGPSGSGKSTILNDVFGPPVKFKWGKTAVVDDFPTALSIEDVTKVCSAVGFNTIPAWLRPYRVLSNGEQFRVTLARALASAGSKPVVMDEFTSVVDRQVAKIGAHAVQKWARRADRKFVAATCHYDVVDWLQPDWVFEPATMSFEWRHLQRRPPVECAVERVPYSYWRLFAPFHYLTAYLPNNARCFVLFAGDDGGQPAAFCGVMHRPHHKNKRIKGVSRLVTLPDWQGLGLAFALVDRVGAAYRALGFDTHTYPAHPALMRSFDRSPVWELRHKPASFSPNRGPRSQQGKTMWMQGRRHNAVFRYRGDPLDRAMAEALVNG